MCKFIILNERKDSEIRICSSSAFFMDTISVTVFILGILCLFYDWLNEVPCGEIVGDYKVAILVVSSIEFLGTGL